MFNLHKPLFKAVFVLLVLGCFGVQVFAAEPVNIKLWMHLDRPDLPYFYDLIKKFNETHPGINMEFELIPWAAAHDKYITSLVAGQPADVIFYATPIWGAEFWNMGALEPLDDYVANWEGRKHIFDSAWETSRVTPDQPIFGVPFLSLPAYLYYRADWFKKLGLNPPETREDLLEAAKKITAEIEGAYGFGFRGARGGSSMWGAFVLPAVDNQWFDENNKSTFSSPEAKAANQWYTELATVHKVVPPTAATDGFSEIMDAFKGGVTGMLIHHLMSSAGIVEALGDENVGVTKIPSVNGKRWADAGIHHYVIPKASKHKKEAFEFIAWLCSPEQSAFFAKNLGSVPVIKGIEKVDPYFTENRFQKISSESVEFAHNPPMVETLGKFAEQTWPKSVQQVIIGEITSDEMMDKLAETLDGED